MSEILFCALNHVYKKLAHRKCKLLIQAGPVPVYVSCCSTSLFAKAFALNFFESFWNCTNFVIVNFFSKYIWRAQPGLFFYRLCECCACAVCICELTQQVHIGLGTTCRAVRVTYLGPAITNPMVANHPQIGHSSETPPNVASC